MGHLSNPISTRLNISRVWNSIWTTYNFNNNYYYLLNNNLELLTILDFLISGKYSNFLLKKGCIFFKYSIIKIYNINIILFYIYDNILNDIITLIYNNVIIKHKKKNIYKIKKNIKNKRKFINNNFNYKKISINKNKKLTLLSIFSKKIKSANIYINRFYENYNSYIFLKYNKNKLQIKKKNLYNTKFYTKIKFFTKFSVLENMNLFFFYKRKYLNFLYNNKKNFLFFNKLKKGNILKKNKFFLEWNRLKKKKFKSYLKKIYFIKHKKTLVRKYINVLKLNNIKLNEY